MNTPLYTRRRLVLAAVPAELDSATRLDHCGNADGANVSPFRRMPIPDDLQRQVDRFRTEGAI